jgi:transcriptional regulator GlxA family with amidase domain
MDVAYQVGEPFRIGIMLYPMLEDLDFVGPLEVFNGAGAIDAMSRQADQSAWEVFTIAETAELVATSSGLMVQPHYTFANHPPLDLLLIPGGDERKQAESLTVQAWLRGVTAHTRITASVCTGAFLLATIGLLDGHHATTHWSSLDRLEEHYPHVQVQHHTRWVDEGTIITSAGISAGIDMSLHIVERLLGRPLAEQVARYMEYSWDERGIMPGNAA